MNHRNALNFPETAPNGATLRQLLLFFDTIFHYLPVEPDPTAPPQPAILPAEFCPFYAPAPLGEERDLFLKIIHNLEKQKQNANGLMPGLSLAHLSSSMAEDRDEVSSSTLSTAIKKGADIKMIKLELLQARVLLKLAESMDRDEQEIAAKLSEIAGSERELLDALKGPLEDEEEWQETAHLNTTADPASAGGNAITSPEALILRRTRAFSRLYCADASQIRPNTIVTASANAAEPLLNGLEKLTHEPAMPLFSLAMPSTQAIAEKATTWPAFIEYREKFQQLVHEPLTVLTGASPDLKHILAAETAWQEAVFNLFGPAVHWKLDWYDFGPVSPEAVFSTAFPGCSPTSANKEKGCGALAVLSRN